MADKKIIAVVGATGAQGGGLVRAIVNDKSGEFVARAITRNVNSDKAKALATLGAEVVQADVDDEQSLRKAFDGAYGAFCVTFFWDHFSPEKELAEARNMAEAARAAGLQHVIWSTLEDTRQWFKGSDVTPNFANASSNDASSAPNSLELRLTPSDMPTLMGKYKVPHLDAKGEANQFFTDLGVPTTFLLTSFYWDNFIHFGMGPKAGPDGRLAITLAMGDKPLPGIAAEDIGRCALGIFNRGLIMGSDVNSNFPSASHETKSPSSGSWNSRLTPNTVGIAGEHLTGAEMAAAFTRALGREVVYNSVSPEVYRGFGFPGADDLGNMFQFKRDFNEDFCGARSLEFSRSLNPALQSFDDWLAQNKHLIPLE